MNSHYESVMHEFVYKTDVLLREKQEVNYTKEEAINIAKDNLYNLIVDMRKHLGTLG